MRSIRTQGVNRPGIRHMLFLAVALVSAQEILI